MGVHCASGAEILDMGVQGASGAERLDTGVQGTLGAEILDMVVLGGSGCCVGGKRMDMTHQGITAHCVATV